MCLELSRTLWPHYLNNTKENTIVIKVTVFKKMVFIYPLKTYKKPQRVQPQQLSRLNILSSKCCNGYSLGTVLLNVTIIYSKKIDKYLALLILMCVYFHVATSCQFNRFYYNITTITDLSRTPQNSGCTILTVQRI